MDEMDILTQWYRDGDIQRKSAPALGSDASVNV